jgi:hypothetical protein
MAETQRVRCLSLGNKSVDFRDIGKFGLRVLDPRELLFETGVIK